MRCLYISGVSSPHVTTRHLLSTVEWERCNFEIGHTRNYSAPSSWYAPSSAYGWVVMYCILIFIVFVGKLQFVFT